MRSASLLSLTLAAALAPSPVGAHEAGARYAAAMQRSWISPVATANRELLYLAGPDGVYIYARAQPLRLVGFIYLGAGVVANGLDLGPNGDVYVLDYTDNFVDEYRASGSQYTLVTQFTQADYGTAVAVGPDGSVYVAAPGDTGGVYEYAPGGGPPTLYVASPSSDYYASTGLALDAKSDLFVSYVFFSEADEFFASRGDVNPSACKQSQTGRIYEYAPHSSSGRCIQADGATANPLALGRDRAGDLVVVD
jgi:hypothetical protein